jgi:hypothetical protein
MAGILWRDSGECDEPSVAGQLREDFVALRPVGLLPASLGLAALRR